VAEPDGPDVTIVIAVRNGERTIERAVAGAAHQAHDLRVRDGRSVQIAVVDDASTDTTALLAQRAVDRYDVPGVVIRRTTRGGPNASRNDGLRATSGRIVVLLDGDDEPLPGWLDRLTSAITDDACLAGGTYVVPGRHGRSAQILASTRQAFGYAYAVGGALATTRDLLDRVGGFDESITRGGTELELCIRAQRHHGARIVPVDDARVLHRVPTSISGRARQHYAREQGHQQLLRRLAAAGVPAPARTAASASWSSRAATSGGWHLLAAEVAGRATGRVVFSRRRSVEEPGREGQFGRDEPA